MEVEGYFRFILALIFVLALIGVFLSWLFGILDFRQALWVVVAIAGIAAAPTIVAAIWTT